MCDSSIGFRGLESAKGPTFVLEVLDTASARSFRRGEAGFDILAKGPEGFQQRKDPYALLEALSTADKGLAGDGMAASPLDGWSLTSIRTDKGISLEEISQNTKIKVSTLQALEAGQFDSLPGGIYNISYIRQYARAVGADEGSLVELYRSKFVALV